MQGAKNILLISYYFPPLGMGGVGRPLGLMKHLPKYGYDVTVLTVKNILYHEYDSTLLSGLDEDKIIRTGSCDPSRMLYLLGARQKPSIGFSGKSILSYLYFPDLKRGWNPFVLRAARKIIKEKNISAIITTSPPPSSHIVGLRLKKETGIPWIADFRDVWFSESIDYTYPTDFQRNFARRQRDRIIASADKIVTVYSTITDCLGRGEVIMNGAELEYSHGWSFATRKEKGKFVIGILGTLNRLSPIEALFKAVARLIAEKPELKDKIVIRQVGYVDRNYLETILKIYPLRNLLALEGYHQRFEAISHLADADLLYLGVFSSRVYDCLMSGKPVLGVISDSPSLSALNSPDMVSLVRDYQYGHVFSEKEEDKIFSLIHNICMKSLNNEIQSSFDISGAEKYSTTRMAGEYARLLDGILK